MTLIEWQMSPACCAYVRALRRESQYVCFGLCMSLPRIHHAQCVVELASRYSWEAVQMVMLQGSQTPTHREGQGQSLSAAVLCSMEKTKCSFHSQTRDAMAGTQGTPSGQLVQGMTKIIPVSSLNQNTAEPRKEFVWCSLHFHAISQWGHITAFPPSTSS